MWRRPASSCRICFARARAPVGDAWRNDPVREVVRKMIPATSVWRRSSSTSLSRRRWRFGLNAPGAKIVASFEYAVRLMELPQGVFGVSLATSFSNFGRLAAEKHFPRFGNLRRAWVTFFRESSRRDADGAGPADGALLLTRGFTATRPGPGFA
ncbi:MAG: hypothetical protein CM1200mP29_00220 [Verrucomicrobiota bacterium]|nr:MAG: hypothetical protein CM1200mP29_00220 [Verrucomicrobiota bacterium]